MTTFEVIRETKKARQLEADGATFWIQKRWQRADGTLTPMGVTAFTGAKKGEKKTDKPYLKCTFKEIFEISDRAVVVKCYDGSSDVLPKSQIKESQVENSILVPCWLANKKDLQFGSKKIWLGD